MIKDIANPYDLSMLRNDNKNVQEDIVMNSYAHGKEKYQVHGMIIYKDTWNELIYRS